MFRSGRNSQNGLYSQHRRPLSLKFIIRSAVALCSAIAIIVVGVKGYGVYEKFLKAKRATTEGLVTRIGTGVSDFVKNQIIGAEGEVETETKISVTDILEIEQLSTLNYQYSGVCPMIGENHKVVYYIAFDGTVTYGIDMSQMKPPAVDDNTKTITLILPQLTIIGEPSVDAGSLEFIFLDPSADTVSTANAAQHNCELYLADHILHDDKLWQNAKDNTYAEFMAMNKPLIDMFFPDYQLVVAWDE